MTRKPGLGKRGNVERNAKVFHVVQRTTLKLPLFENKIAYDYWIFHLKSCCKEEGAILLGAILMPTHYHVLLYSDDYSNIQRTFHRLNSGFSPFIWNRIIKGTQYENLFSETNPFRLFSSTERLFPVEGYIPLLIDTKYLFDNPRHHNSSAIGLRYEKSTFMEWYKGESDKRDLRLFYDLYGGLYPAQVVKLLSKPLQEYRETIEGHVARLSQNTENQLFKVNPKLQWKDSKDLVQESYQSYDT